MTDPDSALITRALNAYYVEGGHPTYQQRMAAALAAVVPDIRRAVADEIADALIRNGAHPEVALPLGPAYIAATIAREVGSA